MKRLGNGHSTDSICVFGTGRSGTSIFFRILGTHPDLGWVSNAIERVPTRPELSVLSRLSPLGMRLGRGSRLRRLLPYPAESVHSLRVSANGLFQLPREISGDEIPSEIIEAVRKYHGRILRYQGRSRLAVKHTGFPRFQFWRAVFPDVRFVHVLRDGRAVVNSLMRVPWWDGTMKSWWWGPMPDSYMLEYENSGRRPAVLAAIVWKYLLDLYESEAKSLPDLPITVVRYERFVSDPGTEMRKVGQICGLSKSAAFEKQVRQFNIRDADNAWRKGLSPKDLSQIELVLGKHLSKYGFA